MPDEARDGRNVALRGQLEVKSHLLVCLIVQNNHPTINSSNNFHDSQTSLLVFPSHRSKLCQRCLSPDGCCFNPLMQYRGAGQSNDYSSSTSGQFQCVKRRNWHTQTAIALELVYKGHCYYINMWHRSVQWRLIGRGGVCLNATRSDDTNLWCLYSLLNYNIPVVGGLNGHVLSAGGLLGFAKWLHCKTPFYL